MNLVVCNWLKEISHWIAAQNCLISLFEFAQEIKIALDARKTPALNLSESIYWETDGIHECNYAFRPRLLLEPVETRNAISHLITASVLNSFNHSFRGESLSQGCSHLFPFTQEFYDTVKEKLNCAHPCLWGAEKLSIYHSKEFALHASLKSSPKPGYNQLLTCHDHHYQLTISKSDCGHGKQIEAFEHKSRLHRPM